MGILKGLWLCFLLHGAGNSYKSWTFLLQYRQGLMSLGLARQNTCVSDLTVTGDFGSQGDGTW